MQQQGWLGRCIGCGGSAAPREVLARAVAVSADALAPHLYRSARRAATKEVVPERFALLTAVTLGVAARIEDAERCRRLARRGSMHLESSRPGQAARGRLTTVRGRDRSGCIAAQAGRGRGGPPKNLLLLRSSGDSKPWSCPDPISPDEAVRTTGVLGSDVRGAHGGRGGPSMDGHAPPLQ